ncbi:MAG: hypothetical protein ACLGHX_08585 [Acidimicrobiia bacterium]
MRTRVFALLLTTAITVLALPLPAVAQRVQSSVVLVREDDVIREDLYAAGNTIVVSGVIEGDLVAVAFDSIRIDGVVEGDVIAISTRVEVSGRVDGSVRVGAGSVSIDGLIGEDLFVGAGSIQAGAGSDVGRDVLVWARTFELGGKVGRNVEGTQTTARVAGSVSGDVEVTTSNLTLLPGVIVGGDVRYVSDRDAAIAETATVLGAVTRVQALPPNLRVRAVRLLVLFISALAALGIGLGILWAAPGRSMAAASALVRSPVRSLAWGGGVASVPVALVIVAFGLVAATSLSAAGPVVLVLVPVAMGVASVIFLGLLTTPVPLSLAVGSRIRPAWSTYAQFVVGFPLLVVVWLLPWVGGALLALGAVAGLGSWLVADDSADA